MFDFPTGYYWAFRKGSPVSEIIFVYKGDAVSIYEEGDSKFAPTLCLEYEPLSEQKWIVDKPVEYA